MKDVIISKKTQKKERQLVVRNTDKIAQIEVAKTSSLIDFDGKYMWAISNVDIDATRNLGLTDIKKYQRLASQIEKKVNELYRDWIPVLAAFMKHFWKTHNNEKVTKNMKIRQDIDLEQVSSFFVQLYRSIHCWKIDAKDIVNTNKLVKKLVRYLLILGTKGRLYQDYI